MSIRIIRAAGVSFDWKVLLSVLVVLDDSLSHNLLCVLGWGCLSCGLVGILAV